MSKGLSGGRRVGGSGGGAPRTPEKFSKNLGKINEKITIFQNFNENCAIFTKNFQNFLEFFAKIWENIRIMQL